jgi:predicted DsbA family dithiol-disulfide isomerase
MVADTMALLIAGGAVGRHLAARGEPSEPGDRRAELLQPWGWVTLCLLAVGGPLLWPKVRPLPPVPAGIRALYAPDKINVVEFADFQCGHCRDLHPRLKRVVKEYGDRVNFIRLHKPLSSHPLSRGAARAAVCAAEQGQEEAMADRLFAAKLLTRAENRKWAQQLGLDLVAFDECVVDPATDARISREASLLTGPEFLGLPTTYVQGQKLVGSRGDEAYRDALRLAAQGEGNRGIPGWAFLLLVAAVVAGVVALGRIRPLPVPAAE